MNLIPEKIQPALAETAIPREADTAGYACPMHPEIQSPRPGMCIECGMALVPTRDKTKEKHRPAAHSPGHQDHGLAGGGSEDRHAGHKTNAFRNKFWISLVLSIPVVLYSDIAQLLLNWTPPQFLGAEYLPFALSSVIFFYGGWVFLTSAGRELRGRLPGMMTLIALAITTAYVYSVAVTLFGLTGGTLYWELATLITVMLLGHWLEMRAVSGAQSALKELSKLLPDTAERILPMAQGETQPSTETVPLRELKEGDLVQVRPGGKIPADGIVEAGQSEVDEALVTGESKPIRKIQGSPVIAGTVNGDGALRIKVTKIGEHTFLAGVMRLVMEAQASKSRLQLLSDQAAYYLTIIAVIVGGTTFAGWLVVGEGAAFAIERLVAVLVITCPHALGLAIPLVASISTTKAAQNGFLIRQRMALEAAREVRTVLFDKTGTLTTGEYGVIGIFPAAATDETELLRLAAGVDAQSEHVIARAVVREAERRNLRWDDVVEFKRLPGLGVEGKVTGRLVGIGGEEMLAQRGAKAPAELVRRAAAAGGKGQTGIYVVSDGEVLGALALADVIRPESREAVQALRAMEVKVAMITGDSEDVAKWVADELGIDQYFARVLPAEKSAKVKLLQAQGEKVAMVGDGVNDAPALTQADVGIAIGAGTNVAIESAGIILVRNDPRDIPKILKLARLTYAKMIQNLFWATGYNLVAIPLAAGALAAWGIFLPPAPAAVVMSLSTVIVAANAVLLKRQEL